MRLLQQGGVKVNDRTVQDSQARLSSGEHVIKVGKRKFYRVRIEE